MKRIGILITHGTDTLAWTHAYVRYAIKNNHANIVLTGSQIPMPGVGEFSDAYENLENSMHFLTNMVPPNMITVFNYGKDAFSDSLRKLRRWDNNAFIGDVVARMEWDEIKYHDETVEITEPRPLDKFYLITTGGTIESDYNEDGVLVPGQNHVLAYITRRFSNYFRELSQNPVFVIDSSDLTFNRMEMIARTVEKCLAETNPDVFADLKFSPNIRIIYTDPFKTIDEYRCQAESAEGVILAGFGGGNINVDEKSGQSLLPLIKELSSKDIPVVLTSQVPVGPADFIYKNAHDAIKAGAISGVDLSVPEIQIRLSYLMGHKDEIRAFAQKAGTGFLHLLEWLFVSGMKFRTRKSLRMYQKLKKMNVCEKDLLINMTIEESLKAYIK